MLNTKGPSKPLDSTLTCYALAQVAAVLGVTETTVRRMVGRGELRATRVGGSLRVTENELRRILEPSEE